MTYPFAVPVTLIQRRGHITGQDNYGNDIYAPIETSTSGVFAPGGSSELTDARDTVITQPTLYDIPVEVDVSAVDEVIVNGDTYEVDGDPQTYQPSPFDGWQVGQVLALRKVTG